ncbi:hypothetical protein [Bacteroides sedimenti]|uniref:Outer membrane protein beta-barrel domain-containing protein n=1 Tax=Bacteroides sedimenti TaxID=2136147 RepID=A0ABM8IE32_9BACE
MRKQIFTIIGVSLLHVSICTQAQSYDSYLLKDYQTPDIKRSSLDVKLNSQGEFTSKDYYEERTDQIQGEANLDFKHYVNTRSLIGEHQVLFNLSGISLENLKASQSKTDELIFSASYANNYRFYTSKKCFWGLGGDVSFSYYKSKYVDALNSKNTILGISPLVMIGRGRIEPIQDARQAVYILDELSRKGIITERLSDDEVNRLAQLISKVKNKRFLDSRLHLIDEISNVDSFLLNNKYLKKTTAEYFTTLYDYWMNGDLFKRGSGCDVSLIIKPFYHNYKNHIDFLRTSQTGFNISVPFNYEKPVNLYWQHSANISLSGTYNHISTKASGDETTYNWRSGIILGGYSIGYYPNTRTNLNVGISDRLLLSDEDKVRYNSATSLTFSANYYVSPHVRISGDAGLVYENSNLYTRYSNRWSGNYSFKLTYMIF